MFTVSVQKADLLRNIMKKQLSYKLLIDTADISRALDEQLTVNSVHHL